MNASILNIIVTPKAKTINYFLTLQQEILSQIQPEEEKKKENGERKKENGERKKISSPIQSPSRASTSLTKGALEEKKEKPRMEVNVNIKQMVADIRKNQLLIASFNISKTSLSLNQRDEANKVHLSVNHVTLQDKRPTKEYSNLFELKYPTTV